MQQNYVRAPAINRPDAALREFSFSLSASVARSLASVCALCVCAADSEFIMMDAIYNREYEC